MLGRVSSQYGISILHVRKSIVLIGLQYLTCQEDCGVKRVNKYYILGLSSQMSNSTLHVRKSVIAIDLYYITCQEESCFNRVIVYYLLGRVSFQQGNRILGKELSKTCNIILHVRKSVFSKGLQYITYQKECRLNMIMVYHISERVSLHQ